MEKQPLSIPYPPEHVFKYRKTYMRPAQEVMQQKQAMFIFERMEYPKSGGQYAYFQGVAYPAKGHPFPEALYGINMAKRLTILGIRFLTSIFKGKRVERLLQTYVEACRSFTEPFILHEQYYTPFARELLMFIDNFLVAYGISGELSHRVAEILASQFEYDNAYRLRGGDILSETTKERVLAHPAKELKRLAAILAEREPGENNREKFEAIAKLFRILMWLPKFRRAFKKALLLSDFDKLQLDEGDRYHALIWADYNFFGKPIEERLKMFNEHPYHQAHGMPKQLLYTP